MARKDTRYQPGDRIGAYTIQKVLGVGGAGAVYLAEHPILKRRVAIKSMAPSQRDDEMKKRFYQEAELMAKLNHPNIVTLYDVGEQDGMPYIAMELLEGYGLSEVAKGKRSVPVQVLLRIMAAIADALQYAHERGIIHKDLKPANVVIRAENGEPVLVDFGLAAPSSGDPLIPEGVVVGTPAYVAPEQASGKTKGSCQTDIWSFGATMFDLFAGHVIYPHRGNGKNLKEFFERLFSPDPVDLLPLEDKAPEFVTDIIGKCLRKDPAERYQSADELKRALEAAIDYIETSQSDTIELALPRKGQTVLLHVEYQESGLPGAFRPYEVGQRIGGGTYGDVYRAVEKLSGKEMALKILKRELVADNDAVTRFRREATLLSRLSHPNIVRVYNFGRYGATFFMAMDLLGERTLADVMEERGPMDVKEALSYLDPTLAGLAAMHEAGIIHRDLKPDNIAIADDQVVVFDFGMAHSRDLKKLTMSGVFVGTPYYASPEQAAALLATGATDVYAAGVILYEMLTGKLPHEAETAYGLLQKIATEPPVPITERRSDLPDALLDVLDRMLAKEPETRPSASEAREFLAAAAG